MVRSYTLALVLVLLAANLTPPVASANGIEPVIDMDGDILSGATLTSAGSKGGPVDDDDDDDDCGDDDDDGDDGDGDDISNPGGKGAKAHDDDEDDDDDDGSSCAASGGGDGLDWASVFGSAGETIAPSGLLVAAAFLPDVARPDVTYHHGGNKDVQDTTHWTCVTKHNPQDKTDILNAYAALAEGAEDRLLLHFGVERLSNNGDATMGFWFLQRAHACQPGSVGPGHLPGDLLVVADFTRGGTVGTIRVYAWDPTVADNLRLVASPAACVDGLVQAVACGVVNAIPISAPWAPGQLEARTFFEGVIDLSALGTSTPCFSSFLAQTRASTSLTASLKDMALGAFATCRARLRADPAQASAPVGTTQPVRFLAERDLGHGWEPAPGVRVDGALAGGPGAFQTAACTTGPDGACSLTANGARAGLTVVTGTATVLLHAISSVVSAAAERSWYRLDPDLAVHPDLAEVPSGDAATGTAVIGGSGPPPTGSVSWQACRPDGTECVNLGSTPVDGGIATSPPFVPPASGDWCFFASYAGDDAYHPGISSPGCFRVVAPESGLTLVVRSLPDGAAGTSIPAGPGATLEYTLTYRNTGDGPARDAALSSAIPPRSRLVECACVAAGDGPGSALAWNLGEVPAGEVRTVAFTVRLDDVFPAGATSLPASATATTREEGPLSSNPVFALIEAAPASSLQKAVRALPSGAFGGAATAAPGDALEYRLRYANEGNAEAADVRITDALPAGTSFLGCTGACSVADGVVTWNLGAVAAGTTRDVFLQVRLDEVFPAGSNSLPNVARVSSALETEAPSNGVVVEVPASPSTVLDKSVRLLPDGTFGNLAQARPGDDLEYRLVVRNEGDADASGVVVQDVLPARTALLSCACDVADGVLRWDLGTLPAGASRTLTFTLRLDAAFPAGTTEVPNVATVGTAEEVVRASNAAPVRVTANPLSALALVASVAETRPGETVDYTLTYRNLGDAPAGNVRLELVVPPRATVLACAAPCALEGGILRWSLGDVAAGAEASLAFRLGLDPVFPAGTTLLTAVAGGQSAEEGALASNEAVVAVVAAPTSALDLAVRVADGDFGPSGQAVPGDRVAYLLSYRNDGDAPAGSVVLSLPLPPRVTLESVPAGCSVDGALLTCALGEVAPGPVWTVEVPLVLDASFPAGVTRLTAQASAASAQDGPVPSPQALLDVAAAPLSRLLVSVSGGGAFSAAMAAEPGDAVVFRLAYRNDGNAPASDLTLTFPLPARATLQGVPDGCAVGAAVVCSLGTVAAEGAWTGDLPFLLDATFPAGVTDIVQTAQASTSEEGGVPANSVVVSVTAAPVSVLTLAVRELPGGAFAAALTSAPGRSLEYAIAHRNDGNAPASGVTLSLDLPPRTTLLSCDAPCAVDGTTLSWALGTVQPGDTSTHLFRLRLDAVFPAGSTLLSAQAAGASGEETGLLSAPAVVTVPAAPLTSATLRVANPPGAAAELVLAAPGDLLEYAISVRNDGNADASGARLSLPRPARSSLVSCACAQEGGVLTWNLGTVAPGTAPTVAFTVRLDAVFPNGLTVLSSVADLVTSEEGSRPSNPVSVEVSASPLSSLDLAVRILPGGSFAEAVTARPDDRAEWRLSYANAGNADASAVALTFTLPGRAGFVSCNGSCTADGDQVRWEVGAVPAGAGRTFLVTTQLAAVFPAGLTVLTGSATATTAEEASALADSATVEVRAAPSSSVDLSVRLLPDGSPSGAVDTRPGDRVEYALLYRNLGDAPASSVALATALPAGASLLGCDPACDVQGGALSWNFGTVDPGDSRSARVSAVLDGEFGAGTTRLVTTATATTTEEGPVPSNAVMVSVLGLPVSQTLLEGRTGSDPFGPAVDTVPGRPVDLQITYRNVGDATAGDVRLSSTVPDRARLVDCGGCAAGGQGPGALLVWVIGDVPAGGSALRSFTVQLDTTFPAGTTVVPAAVQASTREEGAVAGNEVPITVRAQPLSSLGLAVRGGSGPFLDSIRAVPGDLLEWRLRYRNDGDAPAGDVRLSTPIPLRSTLDTCPAPCQQGPEGLTWSLGTVPAGTVVSLTFTARLDPYFPAGTTLLPLAGTVTTVEEGVRLSNTAVVRVEAAAALGLAKVALVESVAPRSTVSYTLAYWNAGNGHALTVTVEDRLPAGTSLVACSPPCILEAGIVRWEVGPVLAGSGPTAPVGTLHLTLRLDVAHDCALCNVAQMAGAGSSTSSEACVAVAPDITLAEADGESAAVIVLQTAAVSRISTSQRGPGSAEKFLQFQSLDVGQAPAEVRATLATVAARSAVAEDLTRHVGYAELANVDILDGLVTAGLVRAVAEAGATSDGTFSSNAGSEIAELTVLGERVEARPGARISLPAVVYGENSYVALHERDVFVAEPSSPFEGTWSVRLRVSMIRVQITDSEPGKPGDQPLEIVVGRAEAAATHPIDPTCDLNPPPSVEARSRAVSRPAEPRTGLAEIGRAGGEDREEAAQVQTTDATLQVVRAAAEGSIHDVAVASSSIEIAEACLIPQPGGCTVFARDIRSEARAAAGPAHFAATGASGLGELVVGQERISADAEPNQVIVVPGVGFAVLNEQVEYHGAGGRQGILVRALRLVVTGAPLGLGEVVVGEALAAAAWPVAPAEGDVRGGAAILPRTLVDVVLRR